MKSSVRCGIAYLMILLLIACGPSTTEQTENSSTPAPAKVPPKPYDPPAMAQSPFRPHIDKFAKIKMEVNTSHLTETELAVLSKLVQLTKVMDELYLRQVYERNPGVREGIAGGNLANDIKPFQADLLELFDLHFGSWDTLEDNKPFFGVIQHPKGAGLYPVNMTKEEFNQWIAAHPADTEAFKSWYTVIRREGDGLKAIPYHQYYKKWVMKGAELMNDAATLSNDASLKHFLTLRAQAFLNDQYRQSEMAWMDLSGTIEAAIGPYEVYTDRLFGYKTFYEAFIAIRNPEESKKLDRYKSMLPEFESNLPIEDKHKNLNRGSESPLVVVDLVARGGEAKPAVQTIAFNLPNDEVVREKKGSKKVMLKNVIEAKYKALLEPIGKLVMVKEQQHLLSMDYFFNEVLFHELSHGLGPGNIVVDGKKTSVSAQLQELYSKIEEGKADVMGMYNMLYLMNKDELPKTDKEALLVTYFAGLFRSMRYGIHKAHGGGAAFQYNYMKRNKGFSYHIETQRFSVNFIEMEKAFEGLLREICLLQALGDYANTKAFLEKYVKSSDEVKQAIKKMEGIPVDINPQYPEI